MSISDVQHQPRAHRILQRALASRRMPHAYLFAGPDGVGREMLAIRLARILLCSSPQADSSIIDACGQCDDCTLVQAGTHPDMFIIHRQLNREHPEPQIRKQKALTLSVDVIRHFVIDRVARRPMRGRAKVFIVREAERLTDAAQNSLLKTLEEPPPDTFLVLVTSALDRMLPTTKSRCQPVAFQPLPADFVAEQLLSLCPETAADELDFAARHSGGSLGTAQRLIDDGVFALKKPLGDRLMSLSQPVRGFAPHLLAGPFIADAKTIGKQASDRDPDMSDTDATRVGLQALLAALAGFYQDAQRQATGAAVPIVNADQPQIVGALAASHSQRQLVSALQQIAQADTAIGRNAALELTIENMFIQLANVAQAQPTRRIAL